MPNIVCIARTNDRLCSWQKLSLSNLLIQNFKDYFLIKKFTPEFIFKEAAGIMRKVLTLTFALIIG